MTFSLCLLHISLSALSPLHATKKISEKDISNASHHHVISFRESLRRWAKSLSKNFGKGSIYNIPAAQVFCYKFEKRNFTLKITSEPIKQYASSIVGCIYLFIAMV